jgi:probable F420-dependent oxidoreductase
MKVGVNVLNFGAGAGPETLAGWAELAEELGYHLAMISDHVAVTPDVAERYPAPFYDPFLALAWLGARTRRLELGTTVIVLPYRHPLAVARLAANLDRLSGGRLILGVGAGWARQEFAALGLPFEHRGAMTDEYLEVIVRAWAEERLSYTGRFVAFRDVATAPPPVRRPPVWVGGSSPAALRRAVRHGDGWHPIRFRLGWLRDEGLPALAAAARAAGRPVPALCPRMKLRLTERPAPEQTRLCGEGSLGQIRGDLAALEALGAAYVLLDTYDDDPRSAADPGPAWRWLRRLAAEVLDLPGETLRR